jgi:hypothetical protein
MKSMYNEEQNTKALEFLAKHKTEVKRISKEKMIQFITDNNLTAIRRIDFNNINITDNIAFINEESGKYRLIITNEKGTITTSHVYENIEEAYAQLVDILMALKTFE